MCFKYRKGTGNIIEADTPFYIWGPWTAAFIGIATYWTYLRFKEGHTVKYPGVDKQSSKSSKLVKQE